MTIAFSSNESQPVGVRVVRDQRGLESFRDPACAAAIWKRKMPVDVITWLSNLAPDALPDGRVILQVKAVAETVRHLCDISGMPNGHQRDWLIADISNLAQCFADLMRAPYLRLRLQVVTTNACRKFHLDATPGRLVCTFRGTGTQYGTACNAHDPAQIFTTPTGVPICELSFARVFVAAGAIDRACPSFSAD